MHDSLIFCLDIPRERLHFQDILYKITATKCLRTVTPNTGKCMSLSSICIYWNNYIHAMFIHWFAFIYHAGTNYNNMKNMGFACCNYVVFNSNRQWLRFALMVVVDKHVLRPTPSTHVLVNLHVECGGILNPLSLDAYHAPWYWFETISST